MDWQILFSSNQPIPLHALCAIAAILVGAFQFSMPKGTPLHKISGYIWVFLMLFIALSSFFINEIKVWGPFSLIHVLSVITIYAVFEIIFHARAGRIKAHKRNVVIVYCGALLITGAFTFLPGRTMHQVFFGG